MGEMVEFKSNGGTCSGYLAVADSGSGPGVIVLQEWWGLVDHIKDVCDRFSAAGYTALAPDLFHGETTSSPDEAQKMFMALNIAETEKDMRGAIDYLLAHDACSSAKVGTVGFCMGGQLSLYAACANPEKIGACVMYYGVHPEVHPAMADLQAPFLGFFAEHDGFITPDVVKKLDADLKAAGAQSEIHSYPGTQHGFFNDTRPEQYDEAAAKDTWERTLKLYEATLK